MGWIPENWDVVKFGSYINHVKGFAFKSSDYQASGRRIIRVSDTTYDSIKDENPIYIEQEKAWMYKKYELKIDDLIFTTVGSKPPMYDSMVGKVIKIPKMYENTLLNQNAVLIRTKNHNLLNQKYLHPVVKSKRYTYFIETIFRGNANQASITLEDLFLFPIPLPPLPEQEKIAEILSTWDEAIEQTRKLIDTKKRRKKALMQQLLTGKKRLPGLVTLKGRKPYRFFDLPEDWECPQIREIAREYSERNTGRDDLTVLSCSKHLGFVESSEYFGKRVFSADTSNYKLIRRGYFGYPSNHIEEGSIGLLLSHNIAIVSPIYIVFKCIDSVIPEYLYAVFKTDTFRHIFAISTNSSVDRRDSLRWREFSLIRVPQPSIKEQQAIVEVLNVADNEIVQLERKLKALDKQKRGLMQKLLTGEVRVNV